MIRVLFGLVSDSEEAGKGDPHQHSILDFELPKESTVVFLKVKVSLFVLNSMHCYNCNKFGTQAIVAKLLKRVSGAEKINTKVSVRDPRCAPTAMVPMPHLLKIAQYGRRKGN